VIVCHICVDFAVVVLHYATLVSLFHQLLESNDYVIELHFTKAGPISNSLKLVNVKKTKEFTAPTLVSLYEIPYPI